MGQPRTLSGREVVAIFAGFGFAVAGQKGSHAKLRRIGPDGRRQTLIVPLHAEMDKGTLRGLLAQGCRFVPAEELWPHFYAE